MNGAPNAPARGVVRWGVPALLVWAQALLSVWVQDRLPKSAADDPLRLWLVLGSGPAASLACLLLIRVAERSAERNGMGQGGPVEDLVVAWIMAFLFGVHAVVLGLASGVLANVQSAVPIAAAALLLGLGLVLARLPFGSVMGLRTRRTLGSAAAWRRAHRALRLAFLSGGALCLTAYAFSGGFLLLVTLGAVVLSLLSAVLYAAFGVPPE